MSLEEEIRLMKMSNDELLNEFAIEAWNYALVERRKLVRQELMRRLQFGYHGRMEDLRGAVDHKTLVNADQSDKIAKMKVLLWEGIEFISSLTHSGVTKSKLESWIKKTKNFLMEQE